MIKESELVIAGINELIHLFLVLITWCHVWTVDWMIDVFEATVENSLLHNL